MVAGATVVACLAAVVPFALSATPDAAAVPQAPDRTAPRPLDALPVPASPPARPNGFIGPGSPAGDSRIVDLRVGDEDRRYFLLPALGLAPGEQAALLVVLHQDVGSAREVAVGLGMDGLRRQGVALAYPAGVGGSWNAGSCCGVAQQRGVDDVGFVNAVLDDVGRYLPVDPDRRALLGYSGGGMLAYRLLCLPHPRLVAAVEVNGSLEAHCANGLQLPDLLAVHGEKDGSIGLTTSRFVSHLKTSPRSVQSTVWTVTGQAGCRPRHEETSNGIERWLYAGCRGGSTVEVQVVPDAGHGWADVGGAARASAFLLPRLTRP
ncbi:MAG: hypothetical protein JWN08_3477 [Frankiales bacterium]|nr:hypothetical protein [Frankiales bacterium]